MQEKPPKSTDKTSNLLRLFHEKLFYERRRKKDARELVMELGKNRRGRAGSLSSKKTMTVHEGARIMVLIGFRSHSEEFGPNGRLRRNPTTACIPCIQAHSSGESAMPHVSLPPLQTMSVKPPQGSLYPTLGIMSIRMWWPDHRSCAADKKTNLQVTEKQGVAFRKGQAAKEVLTHPIAGRTRRGRRQGAGRFPERYPEWYGYLSAWNADRGRKRIPTGPTARPRRSRSTRGAPSVFDTAPGIRPR